MTESVSFCCMEVILHAWLIPSDLQDLKPIQHLSCGTTWAMEPARKNGGIGDDSKS